MADHPRISIIVGIEDDAGNLPATLAALDAAEVEVLICHGAGTPLPPLAPRARAVTGRRGAPVPELWRDGILAARADRLGILSAHCVPAEGWLARALAVDLDAHPAHGGTIALDAGASAVDAAIHVQRYAAVTPPRAAREVDDVAADNAVYSRPEILACADLLEEGFWEPSFHARFRGAGRTLVLDPELRAVHRNRYGVAGFMRQRAVHGRAFGRERGGRAGPAGRAALLLAVPAVPLVFLMKLVGRARGNATLRRRLPTALPWLVLFVLGWTWGEARGYLDALAGSGGAREGRS